MSFHRKRGQHATGYTDGGFGMKMEQIRFQDGASYERYMGKWSQLAGEIFLDWLSPGPGQQWLDVGCGNGAFTEMLARRCHPASVHGVDPSQEQLSYARMRSALRAAQFHQGDAMALPYPERAFDTAVMPLVLFFISNPAKGIAEMKRVVRPGGVVAAYAWDMMGGGFPYEVLLEEIRRLGVVVPAPPSPSASQMGVMRDLWAGTGMDRIEVRGIDVCRTFAGFDDFWETALGAPSVGLTLAAMVAEELVAFKERIRARLPINASGLITCKARANAVKGYVPG